MADARTLVALWRAILLVLAPGLLLVFGLLYAVMPPSPSMSVANGCYQVPHGPMIMVQPTRMTIGYPGIDARPIKVEPGKDGLELVVDRGTAFTSGRGGQITASDAEYANILIQVVLRRETAPALSIGVDDATVIAPKVTCSLARRTS